MNFMYQSNWHVLQSPTPFAESMLWELQRRYFEERGRLAWRHSEVPHYVTCNPSTANCYAEVVFALLADQPRDSQATLHICELGAGSGRFAFHFLQRLRRLCELGGVPLSRFKYILSDYADSNLDAWHKHPRFQEFFASGVLDMALFDVRQSERLDLRLAGTRIDVGSLEFPLVVLANYLFDSVPQDLFYVHQGQLQQCLVALDLDRSPQSLSVTQQLAQLTCRYSYQPAEGALPHEPELQAMLADYSRQLQDTHLLFPTTGLRCLTRLKALSQNGLLLLSADKGDHHLRSLENVPPPDPERHGSFSLQVNFHAMAGWCERSGGLALTPVGGTSHLGVCALLMVQEPQHCHASLLAFRRHAQDFSPDDFYTISLHARNTLHNLSAEDLLAYLRFSHYDAHLFGLFLPRLMELQFDLSLVERDALLETVQKVWDNYYTLGEELDLADHIGYLVHSLDAVELALQFYERSAAGYGDRPALMYNRALCLRQLNRPAEAALLLERALHEEADNAEMAMLLKECLEVAG